MAITLTSAGRNAQCDYFCSLLNSGTLEITDPSDTLLSEHSFSATAAGAASDGVATFNAIGSDTAVATGTAAKSVYKQSDTTVIANGTVTLTGNGGDVILNSLSIATGVTVSITSGTCTQAAS